MVGRTLFVISEEPETPLWATDGTENGIHPVADRPSQNCPEAAVVGESLLLSSRCRGSLLRIDCGGSVVSDVGQQDDSVAGVAATAGRVLFMIGSDRWEDLGDMHRLGASDGWYGTSQLLELPTQPPGQRFSLSENDSPTFTAAGSHIFFSGNYGDVGRELWAMPIDIVPEVIAPDCGWPAPTETEAPPEPTPTPPPPTSTPACDWDGERSSCTQIRVGSASGHPGDTVTIDVTLRARLDAIVAVSNELTFDGNIRIAANASERPACRRNDAIDKSTTIFVFTPLGCAPRTDCTGIRAVVLSLENTDPIPDGASLYTCKVEIDPSTAPGSYQLLSENVEAANDSGAAVPATGIEGAITVARSERTHTIHDVVTDPASEQVSAGGGCQVDPSSPVSPLLALLLLAPLLRACGRSPVEPQRRCARDQHHADPHG